MQSFHQELYVHVECACGVSVHMVLMSHECACGMCMRSVHINFALGVTVYVEWMRSDCAYGKYMRRECSFGCV